MLIYCGTIRYRELTLCGNRHNLVDFLTDNVYNISLFDGEPITKVQASHQLDR
jgi:hypothetical protein